MEAIASQPGIGRWELAETIRRQTGLPVASAITHIRALEREGVLVGAEEGGGYELVAGAASPPASDEQRPEAAAPPPAAEERPPEPGSPPAAGPQPRELAALLARGDPAARRSYRRAREPAVYAYCLRVSSLDAIDAAVVAAFIAMFDDVRRVSRKPVDIAELDDLLLRTTRAEAAERAHPPPRPARLREAAELVLGRASARAVCEVMPKLLAARAGDLLSAQEAELVHRHLAGCRTCRAAEVRALGAERAFGERIAESRSEPTGG